MHLDFEEQTRKIVEGLQALLRDPKNQYVPPAWLRPWQAAVYLNTTESTLTAWRKERRGPKFTRRGNMVRYRIADLDAFMEEAYVERAAD